MSHGEKSYCVNSGHDKTQTICFHRYKQAASLEYDKKIISFTLLNTHHTILVSSQFNESKPIRKQKASK